MHKLLERLWYQKHYLQIFLKPLSWIYRFVASILRIYLQTFAQYKSRIPIVVVGNLSVGGVGKTPLVIAIAKHFKLQGLSVGIVSRGYKSKIRKYPKEVNISDNATLVGDEALLLARKSGCPVVIAPKRVMAIQYLEEHYNLDLIISDDGLQHYAMGRDVEIVVIDSKRYFGNELCLPVGPLREPINRLYKADIVVINGDEQNSRSTKLQNPMYMHLKPESCFSVVDNTPKPILELTYPVAAVAGIGNPERFYDTLESLGVSFVKYRFPDHHVFSKYDLKVQEPTILMTEKDAVKCSDFATESMYYLVVQAVLPASFWELLDRKIQG